MRRILFIALLFLCPWAFAQTPVAPISSIALNQFGQPIPYAQITVCPVTSTGIPCTPLANLYQDYGLTIPLANPFEADEYGNFLAYVPAIAYPNLYVIQISVGQGLYWTYVQNGPNSGGGSGGCTPGGAEYDVLYEGPTGNCLGNANFSYNPSGITDLTLNTTGVSDTPFIITSNGQPVVIQATDLNGLNSAMGINASGVENDNTGSSATAIGGQFLGIIPEGTTNGLNNSAYGISAGATNAATGGIASGLIGADLGTEDLSAHGTGYNFGLNSQAVENNATTYVTGGYFAAEFGLGNTDTGQVYSLEVGGPTVSYGTVDEDVAALKVDQPVITTSTIAKGPYVIETQAGEYPNYFGNPVILGTLTPGNSPPCPNGPNGALTNVNCTGGGATPGGPAYALQAQSSPTGSLTGNAGLLYNPTPGAGNSDVTLTTEDPSGKDYPLTINSNGAPVFISSNDTNGLNNAAGLLIGTTETDSSGSEVLSSPFEMEATLTGANVSYDRMFGGSFSATNTSSGGIASEIYGVIASASDSSAAGMSGNLEAGNFAVTTSSQDANVYGVHIITPLISVAPSGIAASLYIEDPTTGGDTSAKAIQVDGGVSYFGGNVVANSGLDLSFASSGTYCVHVVNGVVGFTASDCGSASGSVTAVTASSPLASSGGTAPNITLNSAVSPTLGGTGINTSSSTGVPQVSSGTWTVSTTLPSGLTIPSATLTAPALGTPASGVATNLTGTATALNIGGNAATATSAGKWTTARLLAGNSVDGSANVAFANKFIVQGTTDSGLSGAQFLGALGTGLVKNTTSTGVLSIASAGTDYQAPLTFTSPLVNTSGTVACSTCVVSSVTTLSSLTTVAGGTFGTGAFTSAYVLPTATSSVLGGVKPDGTSIVNSSGAISVTPTSIGLGNVTNFSQTKAAIVPNTSPSAGQILVGNSGGTAYAPQTVSGDATLASTGALTVNSSGGVSFGTGAFAAAPTITEIDNATVAVVPTAGAINFAPGANMTITTSGNTLTLAASSTAATAFSALTGATNTSAAMVVGSGASLAASGTGTIAATSATTATNFSGSLAGDVTGTQSATNVVKVNGLAVPASKTVVGTNSAGQLIDATSAIPTSFAFSAVTGSTNTTAAMVVGTGSSLGTSGTGTITATSAATATNFSGSLAGDVTGTQTTTKVVKINNGTVPTSAPLLGTNGSAAPIAVTITGLIKGNGSSAPTAATAGTDYLTPTGSGASLTGITPSQVGTVTKVASGTIALPTSAIVVGSCALATATATGALTTDTVQTSANADITGVTGYAPTAAQVQIYPPYLTSGTLNVKVCNPSSNSSSITPGTVVLNFVVVR